MTVTWQFGRALTTQTQVEAFTLVFNLWSAYYPDMEIEVTAPAAAKLLQAGNSVLLDVREPDEVAYTAIKGSLCIPLNDLPMQVERLPRDRKLIVLCHHGMRSMSATQFLRAHGFDQSFNLRGGIDAWSLEVDSGIARY